MAWYTYPFLRPTIVVARQRYVEEMMFACTSNRCVASGYR